MADNSVIENAIAAGNTPVFVQSKLDPMRDPYAHPLDTIDMSDGRIFKANRHHLFFERMRNEAPVHWSETGPTGGFWSVTRYADIMAVDANHRDFSSHMNIAIGDMEDDFKPTMFIAKDQPHHGPQRKSAQAAVAKPRLPEWEAQIRERVADVLDHLPEDEPFDWVERVSKDLTIKMLATLFGMPWEDRNKLALWSDTSTQSELMGNHTGPSIQERQMILLGCLQYFQGLWQQRASEPPKPDFISMMVHNPDTADMIDVPFDFLGNLMLLIVGGNDTTRNSMTGSVLFMHDNPAEMDKLRADPGLIRNMVDEVIRYQTPLSHMRRTATRDVELGGQTIRKGDRVVMWYASGNRDETAIPDPHTFQIDRPNANRHLAFGFGIHRCMGNHIADLQLRVLWEEILKRFRTIEVVERPERTESCFVAGYERMMVRVERI